MLIIEFDVKKCCCKINQECRLQGMWSVNPTKSECSHNVVLTPSQCYPKPFYSSIKRAFYQLDVIVKLSKNMNKTFFLHHTSGMFKDIQKTIRT